MARANYMTIAVPDMVQDMFGDFVEKKEITKTAALTDMLEMYMLASDEELYLKLKKKYLHISKIKDMISDRNSEGFEDAPEFIFMKLGTSYTNDGIELDGEETAEIYLKDATDNGYTWFSTQSLFYGMSKKKVDYFNKLIREGKTVRMLFAINNANIANDIAYSAKVEAVISNKTPAVAPEKGMYPKVYDEETQRIWIKLSNLVREDKIKASMLIVTSTKNNLKKVITNGQFHFGYVSFKE